MNWDFFGKSLHGGGHSHWFDWAWSNCGNDWITSIVTHICTVTDVVSTITNYARSDENGCHDEIADLGSNLRSNSLGNKD